MEKVKFKAIILIIVTIAFQSSVYFLTKIYQGEPYLLNSSLDEAIPFVSWFIYFYIIWYAMLFFIPIILYKRNKDVFYKYINMYLISIVIGGIVFMLFPTTMNRYDIVGQDITSKLVKLIYLADVPAVNCLPSMHCVVAMLFMYGIKKVNVKNELKAFVWVLSICIIISTLFVKQHVMYDIFASLIVFLIALFFNQKFKLWKFIKKIFER